MYRSDNITVSYVQTIKGKPTREIVNYPNWGLTVSRTPKATILIESNGVKRTFPASAKVVENGYSLVFRSPGMPKAKALAGRKPDYIVP